MRLPLALPLVWLGGRAAAQRFAAYEDEPAAVIPPVPAVYVNRPSVPPVDHHLREFRRAAPDVHPTDPRVPRVSLRGCTEKGGCSDSPVSASQQPNDDWMYGASLPPSRPPEPARLVIETSDGRRVVLPPPKKLDWPNEPLPALPHRRGVSYDHRS